MAFMDSVNKGLATLNVKTSNLMESSKIKAAIANKEAEIASLKTNIGETLFLNRNNFSMDMVSIQLSDIEERMAAIDQLKQQMKALEDAEKDIIGKASTSVSAKIYCTQCGAPNDQGSHFCEKCGAKIVD